MRQRLPFLVLAVAISLFASGGAQAQRAARLSTVVLGDSITEGGRWADHFPAENLVNMGVGGDTTTGMLARADQVQAAKPGKVLLMAGINDLLRGRSVADTLATYAQLLARLDDGGKRLVVQSTLFIGPPGPAPVNEKVRALNDGLFQLCTANRRCTFIDLNETLAPAGVLLPGFTVDGLHLNQAGYDAWFKRLRARRLMD